MTKKKLKQNRAGAKAAPKRAKKKTVVKLEEPIGWKSFLPHILIFAIGLLVFSNTFTHDFTLDDIPIIQENPNVEDLSKVGTLFKTHYWAGKLGANDKGLYRPLTMTTYAIQNAIHGEKPGLFHLVNGLLHALCCVLIFMMLMTLFDSKFLAFATAAIFAVHPIHSEAVAGVVGRAELMCMLFMVSSIWFYFKSRVAGSKNRMLFLSLSVLFAAFSALSKELGFLTPVFILMSEILLNKKRYILKKNIPAIVTFMVMVIVLLGLWFVRAGITEATLPHEDWQGVISSTRMLTALSTCLDYSGMLLFPISLSADYGLEQVPLIETLSLKVILALLLILVLAAIAIAFYKKQPAITWGLAFFGITLLPVSNLPFAIGVLKAERILYAPSLGFILALVGLLSLLYQKEKWRKAIIGILLIYGLALAGKTFMRNFAWKNQFELSMATLITSPESARFNNIFAQELKKRKRTDEALPFLEKAVALHPDHLPAVVNLALIYRQKKRQNDAERLLESALKINPQHFEANVNLMSVYRDLKKYDKAIAIGEQAITFYPNEAAVHWNLGNAYLMKGDQTAAEREWAIARKLDPNIGK